MQECLASQRLLLTQNQFMLPCSTRGGGGMSVICNVWEVVIRITGSPPSTLCLSHPGILGLQHATPFWVAGKVSRHPLLLFGVGLSSSAASAAVFLRPRSPNRAALPAAPPAFSTLVDPGGEEYLRQAVDAASSGHRCKPPAKTTNK